VAEAPWFIRGDGVDALAEYRAFLDAVGEPASHLFAELVDVQENGPLSSIIHNANNVATHVRDLYCRIIEGWAVFFHVRQAQNRCPIGIVHVGSLNPHPFDALKSEAQARLREAGY
jgi:hypothetical protein